MARRLSKRSMDPLEEVFGCINSKKSFVLEAGAGSGKTRSLVEALKYTLDTQGSGLQRAGQEIVCITYTNVAKDEIVERIESNPLVFVGTIHEFLWHAIRNYQNEIKREILDSNAANTDDPISDLELITKDLIITYSQYGRRFDRGEITHEDVIEFSSNLFNKYPKILRLVGNKYPYIFVDEYQDTEERTIQLLLRDLLPANLEKVVVGFFGDSMQNIYDGGVGSIPSEYIDNDSLTFITKSENFRSSKQIVELLNKIRSGLVQTVASENTLGTVTYIHCNSDEENPANYEKTIAYLSRNGWDFTSQETKVLLLTHKNIAVRAGYDGLLETYSILSKSFGRDRLIEKDEAYSDFFLNKVEKLVFYYDSKNYSEFVRLLGIEGFKITAHGDKAKIQKLMSGLGSVRNTGTAKDVIDYVLKHKLVTKTSKLEKFEQLIQSEDDENIANKKEFYNRLMAAPYKEFVAVNRFIEGSTPYSTKHGVKGAEFNNVLVIINDNHKWHQYNKFNDVIASKETNEARSKRITNLLYVCCSRAKNKLAVLSLSKMDVDAMNVLTDWFGTDNIIDITTV